LGARTLYHSLRQSFRLVETCSFTFDHLIDVSTGTVARLGGISGIELQRRLAASGSKCPVIFMTANDDEATRNEAVDAGCIAYLRKPFARQVLLNAIGKAVA
jgi:FixJ family two-component response regulator